MVFLNWTELPVAWWGFQNPLYAMAMVLPWTWREVLRLPQRWCGDPPKPAK